MSTPDRSARVLLVEDDLGLAGIVVRHLRARGHEARSAASTEDAVQLLRAGCRIVEVTVGRGEKIGESMPESFDRVLLDVPCSGEGRFIVFEPGTSRAWSTRAVADSVRLQRKLLASGARALKPGGVLVYATCTLNREENELMVDWAVANLPLEPCAIPLSLPGVFAGMARGLDPRVARAIRVFPDAQREGFFICRMTKT